MRACAPTDSGALRNVSAVCGSVCSSATLHAPPVHVRASAQRLRTPSWRHGYRHSNTTCVQGCARTPPRPARCCPDALTPPVRENGRLPRALAPLHRPPAWTESSFFCRHFFAARADRAAAAAATRGIRIRSRSAARRSGRSPPERTRAHPQLSGRARAALRDLSRVRSKNSIMNEKVSSSTCHFSARARIQNEKCMG